MKIILLKDIAKVGRKYDIKDVAEGFALNMLIPRGVAQIATPGAIKKVEEMKSRDMTDRKIQEELLLKNLEVIKNLKINLKEKASDKGHLFAGITKEMLVSEILKSTRLNLDPESIKLAKPIKEVGEHFIAVEALGKKAEFTLKIEAE
ncbi:MAG: 50S ribosomal protein L9 [Minisyncoccia bacterium]